MDGIKKLLLGGLMAATPTIAMAEFPDLSTKVVIPGCRLARTMDESDSSLIAASRIFSADPRLGIAAGYCAGWVNEAFQAPCISNELSMDDVMLVIINYSAKHPEYDNWAFIAIASEAMQDQWPACKKTGRP